MTDSSADQVLTSLRRVIRAIEMHSKRLSKTASVTGPQLRLMQLIAKQAQTTISELSKQMSLSQATVTTIMDRLEKRGLVARIRSLQDKRKVHPQLTDQGRELLTKSPTALQDSFVRRFNELKDWEQAMLIASIQRVAEMMDATGLDASPYLDVGALDRAEDLQAQADRQ